MYTLFCKVNRLILLKKKVKNNVDLTVGKRKSDKLRILKVRDMVGPGKQPDDPLVMSEYETTINVIGGAKISKSWADI